MLKMQIVMTKTETSVMVEMVARGSMAKMEKTLLMSPVMQRDFLPGISWVLSSSERLLLVVSITQPIHLIKAHLSIEQHLSDSDMALLRAFALKVESHMTDQTFAKLPQAFPND